MNAPTSTTWKCKACGHVTTLTTPGGWSSLPNGYCHRRADGKHDYGEPVRLTPSGTVPR